MASDTSKNKSVYVIRTLCGHSFTVYQAPHLVSGDYYHCSECNRPRIIRDVRRYSLTAKVRKARPGQATLDEVPPF